MRIITMSLLATFMATAAVSAIAPPANACGWGAKRCGCGGW